MTNLHVFNYNDYEITFDFSKEHKIINALQMAKVFGKKANDFLRLKSTKEYVKALLIHLNKSVAGIPATEKDLIYTHQGGNPALQGTWVHKLIGIRLAQWLDPFFAIWVDEKIEELLVDGFTTLEPATDFRVIYFVKAKLLNRVKIGMTNNLKRRMEGLKTDGPDELELLKIVRVNEVYQSDSDVHALFPHLRLHGEWFELTKELQHFIDNLVTELPLMKRHKNAAYHQNLAQLEEKIQLLQKHLEDKDKLIDNLTSQVGDLQKECYKLLKREEKVRQLEADLKAKKRLSAHSSNTHSPTSLQEQPNFFYYKDRHLFHKIAHLDIVFIEGAGDHSIIHTQDGKQHTVLFPLNVLEKELPTYLFVRPHHKYIVHLRYITTIDSREKIVYLHRKWQWQVPIARRQQPAFLKHIKKLQEG